MYSVGSSRVRSRRKDSSLKPVSKPQKGWKTPSKNVKLKTLERQWNGRHGVGEMPSYNSLDDPYCPLTQAKKFTDFAASTVSGERVGHSRQGSRRSNQLDPIRKSSTAPVEKSFARSLTSVDPRSSTASPGIRKKKMLLSQTIGSMSLKSLEDESFDGAITVSTSAEAGSHFEIVKKIMQREHVLEEVKMLIAEVPPTEPSFGWMPHLEALLMTLRTMTMEITEAISVWKIQQGNAKQFIFNSENYLMKIRNDLAFLDEHEAISNCMGFPFRDNPFLAPTPYRGQPEPNMPSPDKLIRAAGADALRIRDCTRIVDAEVERYGEVPDALPHPQVSLSTLDGTGWTTLELDPSNTTGPGPNLTAKNSLAFGGLNAHNNIMVEDCDAGNYDEPPGGWGEGVSSRYSTISEKHGIEYLAQAKKPVQMIKKLAARIRQMNGEIEAMQENIYSLEKEYNDTVEKQKEIKEKAYQVSKVLGESGQGSAMQRSLSRLALKLSEWEEDLKGREKKLKAQRCKLFFERQELDRKIRVRDTVEDKLEEEKEKAKQRQEKRARIRLKKQHLAAITIQRHGRGMVTRNKLVHQRTIRDNTASFLQVWARRQLVRKSLERLGVSVSTHLGRKKELERRIIAARIIQTYSRRMLAIIKFKRLLKRKKRRAQKEGRTGEEDCESVSTQATHALTDAGSVKAQELEKSFWQTIGSQSIYYYINAANMDFMVGNMSDADASMHMEAAQYEMEKSTTCGSPNSGFHSTLGSAHWLKERQENALAQKKEDRISSITIEDNKFFIPEGSDGRRDSSFSPGVSSMGESDVGFDSSGGSSLRNSIQQNAGLGAVAKLALEAEDAEVETLGEEPDFDQMAVKIQAAARGKAGRAFFKREKLKKVQAAIKLQAFHRGRLARLQRDRSKIPMKSFKDLSIKESASWINSIGLSMYESNIIVGEVDGAWLSQADHSSLKEIGIAVRMHRVRLLREIDFARYALFAVTVGRSKLRRRRRKKHSKKSESQIAPIPELNDEDGKSPDSKPSSPISSQPKSKVPIEQTSGQNPDFSVEALGVADESSPPQAPVERQPSDSSFQTADSLLNIMDKESLMKLEAVKSQQSVLEHKISKLYGMLSGFNSAEQICTPPESGRQSITDKEPSEKISEMYDQSLVCSAMISQITDLAQQRLAEKTKQHLSPEESEESSKRLSMSQSVMELKDMDPSSSLETPEYTFREEDYETLEGSLGVEKETADDAESSKEVQSLESAASSKEGSYTEESECQDSPIDKPRVETSRTEEESVLTQESESSYIVKAEFGSILQNFNRLTHSSQGPSLGQEDSSLEDDTTKDKKLSISSTQQPGDFFSPDTQKTCSSCGKGFFGEEKDENSSNIS